MAEKGSWRAPTIIGGRAYNIVHCTNCGCAPAGVDENTKYCPHCGSFNGKVEKENKEVSDHG